MGRQAASRTPPSKKPPRVQTKGGSLPTENTKRLQAAILNAKRDDPSLNLEDLAEMFDISGTYASKLYRDALREIIQEPAKDVLKMELARLDDMQKEVMRVLRSFHPVVNQGRIIKDIVEDEAGNPVIMDGKLVLVRLEDAGPKLAAIDRALKIMERRSKFLGLDKEKGDPNKEGMTPEEFAAKVLKATRAIDEISGAAGG